MSPSLNLPAESRLRSRQDFASVYKHGVRARGKLILVVAAPSPTEAPRFGLSVGRKYSKKAVTRNRARRCFREAFRLARPDLPPLDFIFIPALSAGQPLTTPEVRKELIKLIPKLLRKL